MKTSPTIRNNFELYLKNVHQRRSETHEDGHLITYNEITVAQVNLHRQHFFECWKIGMSAHKSLMFLGMELSYSV